MFIFVFNQDNLYAQGQGQGGPPIWRLDGNSVGDGDFLGTTNDMPLVFKINSSETMRLLPGGNVGIGLSHPQAKLDVNGNAIFRDAVYVEKKLEVGSIKLYAEGNNLFVPGERGYLYIQSRNDSKHTIINNNNPGYVGIGTEKPGKKLHVKETRSSGYDPKPRPPKEKVNVDSTLMDQDIRERDSLITNTEKRGSIRLELTVPQEGKSTTWDIQPTVSNYTNKMPGSLHFIDAEKKHTVMTMQDNGAVGIGTILPSSRLHVHGGNLTLTKGRMGIGVQRPQAALDVVGEIHATKAIAVGDDNAYSGLIQGSNKSLFYNSIDLPIEPDPACSYHWLTLHPKAHDSYMGASNEGGIKFATTLCGESTVEEKMRITPHGKVGIGTQNPECMLEIEGDDPNINLVMNPDSEMNWVELKFSVGDDQKGNIYYDKNDDGMYINNIDENNNHHSMVLTQDGDVGIGTISPEHKLDVCGVIRSTEEVLIETSDFCDFVFEPDYNIESFDKRMEILKEQKHLRYIKPENEIIEEGIPVNETIKGLVQNLEEVYLYMDDLHQDVKQLKERIEELESQNKSLKKELSNK